MYDSEIVSANNTKRDVMNVFERYLTVWVSLCIVAGILVGRAFPNAFQIIARIEVAHINLPVAVLVWLMIIPMLIKIDLKQLKGIRQYWRGVGVTLFVNWGVKPFSMALLAWFFIDYLFREYLPAEQIDSYIAGLVILAAAPCTAMVFVWSHLTRGEPHFTLSQVALNDVIMVFAFAPIVALLLGLSAIALFGFESGAALATVVGVLIEVPVMLLAVRVINRSRQWYERRDAAVPYEV